MVRTFLADQSDGHVRAHDIEDVRRRLGLTVRAGSRVTPNGDRLEWRAAGMDEAAAEGYLPFFIERGAGTAFPGHALVKRRPVGLLARGHELPIVVIPGNPTLAGVVLSGADRFAKPGWSSS